VAVFEALVRSLGRVRLGIVFDGIGRTQRFAFQARCAEQIARMGNERSFRATKPLNARNRQLARQGFTSGRRFRREQIRSAGQPPCLMVRGFADRVKPGRLLSGVSSP
jgi:hypothetical protein